MLAGHVIVCGLEGIGVTIVEQLHRCGQQVVVVGQYATAAQLASVSSWTTAVVSSAGTLEQTLDAAGLQAASAIVCVVPHDLQNVQIALQARHMSQDVRVVSQLGNKAVRRAMAVNNGPGAVIDSASLAAPAIVEACLGRRRHAIEIEDVSFAVATVVAEAGTLRSQFGDLAPVAVTRTSHAGGQPEVFACPGRDFVTAAGDLATVLGTPPALAMRQIDMAAPQEQPEPRSLRRRVEQFAGGARAAVGEFDPGLFRALSVLVTLVAISTLLLHWQYRKPAMSPLDSLYFSVETVATVGFGDFSFIDQSWYLRVWAIFLMLAGVTTTAVLMAYLADFLISRRLNGSLGRRRARTMSGHVIVVGLGAFGLEVARGLIAAGKQVVVVEYDTHNRFLGDAAALDLPVIFGDATAASTLEWARLRDAAAIAVLTSDDMVNIETGIAVRDLLDDRWVAGAMPVVMRVFDRSLSRTIAARFDFENIQSIEEITAPWFVAAALGLDVLGAFAVSGQPFTVGRLTVAPGGALAGTDMQGLSASTRVIALKHVGASELEHPPRRGTQFQGGDLAYIIGPNDELIEVLRRAAPAGTNGSGPAPGEPAGDQPEADAEHPHVLAHRGAGLGGPDAAGLAERGSSPVHGQQGA
jgi:Trk K+ transport system NAD-binding subunit